MATRTQIKAKVRECVEFAKQKYGFSIPYSRINIEFKSKGQAAASAWHKPLNNQFGLRFSTESASLDSDEMLNDTIPHEVAHLVCMYDKTLGKNHDYGWIRVCRGLGGTGIRTHNQTLTKGRYRTQYIYKTDSGAETTCGAKVHNRIQLGASYTYRPTGESFGKSHYHRTVSPEEHRREHQQEVAAFRAAQGSPAQAPTSHKRPTLPTAPTHDEHGLPLRASIPVAPGASKKVRAMAIYKAFSTNDRPTIIGMFMRELDMTKAGATTYYYNCTKS